MGRPRQFIGKISTASVVLMFGLQAQALVVCPQCEVRSISAAIELASEGETVVVKNGTYYEHDIVVSKKVLIRAARGESPVIDSSGVGNSFLVQANGAEISGLTIRNPGLSHLSELAGIRVEDVAGCRLVDNTVEGAHFGIYLAKSSDCVIEGNRIIGAKRPENLAGNGIHIWNGQRIRLERNIIRRCRDGIYFEFVSGSEILNNQSGENLRYGLHFMFSNNNLYRGNSFANNESGVAVMYSKKIRMINNTFINSRGPAAYGILLKDISESDIRANRFSGNTVGVYVEGTTRSVFVGNLFENNGWAMRILGDSDGNAIAQNNFLSNTLDVATNATINLNQFSGNYWSRYKGIDLDHNGVGDDPYHPVQLTSMLMEKYGASVLLINSFFFTLLDQVESVMPVLTPKAFVDATPRMHRVTSGT